jgi:hypothetical protein
MIPLNFGLFWAGETLSYLRYLTFKTLRYHHPHAKIKLYYVKEYNKEAHKWNGEAQDFEKKLDIKNYLGELSKLDVETVNVKYVGSPDLPPNVQSDIFRWLWLRDSKNYSFYLDVDQIILRSFDTLPLDNEFIYSRYNEIQCGDYLPCGVIFIEEGSKIPDIAIKCVLERYNPYDYNSSGPWAMRNIINKIDLSRAFNAPYNYFYPINSSSLVDHIYSGRYIPNNESYAIHWYGGHPKSQEFNIKYTEEFARNGSDSISKYIREKNLI